MSNIHIPYNQVIEPYHEVIAHLAQIHFKVNGSVLDLGCGVGHTLALIQGSRVDLNIYAADIDKECLDITENRVKLTKRILLNSIDEIYTYPMSFDGIIMSHSLEHMNNPFHTLQEMYKKLNKDGVLILAVPNPVRLSVILSNLMKKQYSNKGHIYAWDRSHWINFLENIMKFNVILYTEDYFPLPLSARTKLLRPFEKILVKIFPWFAFSNIAVIKK